MRGNLYSVKDFDKKLTERFKELYHWKEKTLKMFSNSDFYDIKLKHLSLTPKMNGLICDYISYSASTHFNIFMEFVCYEQRARSVPDNLYFFTLKKLVQNDFVFGIKYKNECDKILPNKQKQIYLKDKTLKYLLNYLFNVTLIFRKFYPDLDNIANRYYKYSFANYRFMIFEAEFPFRNIIGLPKKRLMAHYSYSVAHYKPVLYTKIKLSGKLPASLPSNDVDSILNKSFDIFSKLNGEYKIKSVWRLENNFAECENDEKFKLKALYTDDIQGLFCENDVLNSEILSIKEYSSSYEFRSKGSIELPDFERKTTIHLSWRNQPYSVKFKYKENDKDTRKYILVFILFSDVYEFEILTDKDLKIVKILEKSKKKIISKKIDEITDNEKKLERILNEITLWL